MTTTRHTPIETRTTVPRIPANAATFNAPLSQLDSAVLAVEADVTTILHGQGAGGWYSIVDALAASGQKVVPVATPPSADAVNASVYIGAAALGEVIEIASVQAGVSITSKTNLVYSHAAGTPISATPAEVAGARGGYATLGERMDAGAAVADILDLPTAETIATKVLAPNGTGGVAFRAEAGGGAIDSLNVYNVKDHGAVGNGVADDTAALQAAFALLATTVTNLYIPAGTYLVTDTLDVPYTQYRRIFGAGSGITRITMTANNKPIIRASNDNTHTISIEDLMLGFLSEQPKTNTSAYGILFTESGGTGEGFYVWGLKRLFIQNAAIGIGIGGPTGTGAISVWGSVLESITMSRISSIALDWISPGGVGMPNMTFRDIRVLNGGTPITGVNQAVKLNAVGAMFEGLDIENWYNGCIYIIGGGEVSIRHLAVEHHTFTQDGARLVSLDNGPLLVEMGSLSGDVAGAITCSLFSVGTGASLDVKGITSEWIIPGASLVWSLDGDEGGLIWSSYNNWQTTAKVFEYAVSAYGTALYCRVLVDGLPPVVDALPTPAIGFRGRRFRVLGRAGVADVVSECSKNAADAYVWVTK